MCQVMCLCPALLKGCEMPAPSRRLDRVLISETLEFISYEVLPDVLSDHKAVVVEIGFSDMDQDAAQYTAQQASRQ